MDGDGAEAALAVTAAVGGDGEADGFEGTHRAEALVMGVLVALEIEGVDAVEFGLREGQGGRVLHQETVTVFLEESFCSERVVVLVEGVEHVDEGLLVLHDGFIIG